MTDPTATILRGRVLLPDGLVEDAVIEIRNGAIADVRAASAAERAAAVGATIAHTIAPGMVDLHIHGADGHSAMGGPAALRHMARYLAGRGVTAFLPTALSAPIGRLVEFLGDVAEARRAQATERAAAAGGLGEAEILGANLEGPCLAPTHRGAHELAALVPPSALLEAWRARPSDWAEVRVVTLAPELPGGMELVRLLAAEKRVGSVGHTAADFEQTWAAFDAGARSTTHLFNRMTPLHHRAPGAVTAALTHPAPGVELIADGVHVLPPVWPIIWRSAGDRLLLVSDALPAAGLGDGEHTVGALRLRVQDGRATLEDGTLAGSTTTLDEGLRNVLRSGLDVAAASRSVSTRPAALAGAERKGVIAAGADADLLLLGGDGRVERVMIGGHWLST